MNEMPSRVFHVLIYSAASFNVHRATVRLKPKLVSISKLLYPGSLQPRTANRDFFLHRQFCAPERTAATWPTRWAQHPPELAPSLKPLLLPPRRKVDFPRVTEIFRGSRNFFRRVLGLLAGSTASFNGIATSRRYVPYLQR